MDKQRTLKEAQKIASKYSFWMVSGNINHLYGYVYDSPEKKYELEIKFSDDFPKTSPIFFYHNNIRELLGEFKLKNLELWTPDSNVVDIVDELKIKIQEHLSESKIIGEEKIASIEDVSKVQNNNEYLTPDLDAYPPDSNFKEFKSQKNAQDDSFYARQKEKALKEEILKEDNKTNIQERNPSNLQKSHQKSVSLSIVGETELSLIQQYYTYDQKEANPADIEIYMTISISNTFKIGVNFRDYPNRPIISFPEEIKCIIGDPYTSLSTLKKWSSKKSLHIVEVLQEIEGKLFFIKDIETESKKISGEYKTDTISNSISQLTIHLYTYGFREYLMDLDLAPYPKPPKISLTSELEKLINISISSLESYKNWKEGDSEPIQIVREISWLVDKNSRINFEIDLLKANYKDIKYDSLTEILLLDMKGKMKTEDLTFNFQINLSKEYPMKIPEVLVLNKFELETHEKIKSDLETSLKAFAKVWTPFSYLVDLFNVISKKIFEISVLSCVICHNIQCPSCSLKIGGSEENCYAECPHCRKSYHKHCFEQTLISFGKCGFCLKPLL